MKISAKEISEIFHYDPDTGDVTYLSRPRKYFKTDPYFKRWNTIYSGRVARNVVCSGCSKDYILCSVNQSPIFAHKIAFAFMNGRFPEMIDHIDGDGTNNKWSNLREVTRRENQRNLRMMKTNKSGVTGVYKIASRGKWLAAIHDGNGVEVRLAYTEDKFEAICARKSAEISYGYHENHGKKRPSYCSGAR